MSRPVKDLTGHKYNRWTVVAFSHLNSGSHWLCQCDCGTVKTVRRQGLISGTSKSCGCFNIEASRAKNTLSNGEASFNKLYSAYRSGAKDGGRAFNISKKDFKSLTSSNCHYCDSSPSSVKKKNSIAGQDYIYNGVDRKDNNLGYLTSNCVTCCWFCNQAKHTSSYEEFMMWIGRIKYNAIVGACVHEWRGATGEGYICNKCNKGHIGS